MASPEVYQGKESNAEIEKAAGERLEKLRLPERTVDRLGNARLERVETARQDAKEIFSREAGKERDRQSLSISPRSLHKVTRQEKTAAYNRTMSQIRTEIPPASRSFSRFIHAPAIEKASQVLGSTAARPNALLFGGIAAFITVLISYFLANKYGYQLSGFETIGAFFVGWALGLIYDFAKTAFSGRP